MKYLRKFETQAAYAAAESGLILPNVSLIEENNKVEYKPYVEPVETRVVVKYNVTDTSSPTKIYDNSGMNGFSAIEIDGVEQPSVVSSYTFSTIGEHTVKYTLTDSTQISSYAFMDCTSLISVNVPNNVTLILTSAFKGCINLTSAIIGNSVRFIGPSAFYSCSGLTSVNIPNSVLTIADSAFYNCSGLTSVMIGSGVTTIGSNIFGGCHNISSITCNATTAPTISNNTFTDISPIETPGKILYVPIGSSGYDVWMGTEAFYLGYYKWTKIEQ